MSKEILATSDLLRWNKRIAQLAALPQPLTPSIIRHTELVTYRKPLHHGYFAL